jgi:hypothetical protein
LAEAEATIGEQEFQLCLRRWGSTCSQRLSGCCCNRVLEWGSGVLQALAGAVKQSGVVSIKVAWDHGAAQPEELILAGEGEAGD